MENQIHAPNHQPDILLFQLLSIINHRLTIINHRLLTNSMVGGLEHVFFPETVGNVMIPTDEPKKIRGVGGSTTKQLFFWSLNDTDMVVQTCSSHKDS